MISLSVRGRDESKQRREHRADTKITHHLFSVVFKCIMVFYDKNNAVFWCFFVLFLLYNIMNFRFQHCYNVWTGHINTGQCNSTKSTTLAVNGRKHWWWSSLRLNQSYTELGAVWTTLQWYFYLKQRKPMIQRQRVLLSFCPGYYWQTGTNATSEWTPGEDSVIVCVCH